MKSKEYLIKLMDSKGVHPVTNKPELNYWLYPIEFTSILADLEVLEILKNNLTLKNGNRVEFYKDKERNINTKIDVEDYEKVVRWLTSNKNECKILHDNFKASQPKKDEVEGCKCCAAVEEAPRRNAPRRDRPRKPINKGVRVRNHGALSWTANEAKRQKAREH